MPHYFRPRFTKYVFNKLLEGSRAISVTGPKGMGKTRFINDGIKFLQKEHGLGEQAKKLKCIRVCIDAPVVKAFEVLEQQICNKLGCKTWKELTPCCEGLKLQGYTLIFIFERFDRFFRNKNLDERYDATFFSQINSLKNLSSSILITALEEITEDMNQIYHQGELISSSFNVDLPMPIQPFSQEEIQAEIEQLYPRLHSYFEEHEMKLMDLVKQVEQHEKPYSFLDRTLNNLVFKLPED